MTPTEARRKATGHQIARHLLRRALRAGLMAAALAAAPTFAASAAQAGDILRIGATLPIDSLNPFVANADYASVAYQYAYPFLTTYDRDLKIVPYFATSWEPSDGGRVWTFHTRPGAKWSDGTPLTAKDAAFTFNMINKFRTGSTARLSGWVTNLVKAETPDDNTLVLTYSAPAGHVPVQMQALPILPAHVWAPIAEGDGTKITSFQNETPWVSGGPFVFAKHAKDQLALFRRNPAWWGEKKPAIDGFGLQFFANDDAMVTALVSGQIDMTGSQTPATAVETLRKAGMVVDHTPSTGFKTLILNSNTAKKQHRELLDPKVREAMEYAIDRDAIVNSAWLGYSTPGSTIVAPSTGWHDNAIKGLPFDIEKANALLDAAGYKLGPNGVRIAGDHPMAYEVIFPTEESGTGDRVFQIIRAGLAKAGIAISMRKLDTEAASEAILAPDGKYEDFDLAMWNWVPPVDPDFVLSVLTCAQRGSTSDTGYCNPEYDALYAEQGKQVDEAARRATVDKMQALAYAARPYIVLNYPDVIEAHNPAWKGFVLSPLVGSVNNISPETLLSVHKE